MMMSTTRTMATTMVSRGMSRSISTVSTLRYVHASSSSSSFLLLQRPCHSHTTTNNAAMSSTSPCMPQRRTMVMVTKTSSSSLPEQQPQPTTTPASSTTTTTTNTTTTTTITSPPTIVVDTNDLKITQSCFNRIAFLNQQKKQTLNGKDDTNDGNDNNDDDGDDALQYLRVYVDAGGCSGFQYKFEMSMEALDESEDVVFSNYNNSTSTPTTSRVVVDLASLELLRGSTIDFVQEMIRSSFAVTNNPQSESACGCGSSFAVKNFSSHPALD